MTIDQISWIRLKPYKRDSRKSFEQLCYQIAKECFSDLGIFTPIDDSGGGSGIEFFLELPNGDIWGWQAKYYPDQRLNSNRREKIRNSLQVSKRQYGNRLKCWYLCTPLDLKPKGQPGEIDWFKNELTPTAGTTQLVHWGDSELTNLLRKPELNGILQFFFGDFQPRPEWFENQVKNALANLGNKYIPQLHTTTNIDFQLHTLIGSAKFIAIARKKLTELGKSLSELRVLAQRITSTVDPDFTAELAAAGNSLQGFCTLLDPVLVAITSFVATPFDERNQDISAIVLKTMTELRSLWETLTASWRPIQEAEAKLILGQEDSSEKQRFRTLQSLNSGVWKMLDGVVPSNLSWFSNQAQILKGRALHLIGGAGAGKTHVLAQICSTPEVSGIFLQGISFSEIGTIQAQILEQLDLKITWKELLASLSAYSASYGKQVLIAVDALNEAGEITLWTNQLRGFEQELKGYSGIAFITSCRPSYVKPIWGDDEKPPFVNVSGFDSLEVKKAVAKYFEYFKISASLTLVTLDAFKHPLYLSIFCHATNRDRSQVKHVFLGQQSLFSIFEKYLDAANISFSIRIDRPFGDKLLHKALRQFAKRLWEKNKRSLPAMEARTLFDGNENVLWSISTTKALLNEELILSRSFRQEEEEYEFTYDLLGGYLISEQALTSLPDNFAKLTEAEAALNIEKLLEPLTAEDFSVRHPLHEDILRAFAALLPARQGRHLPYLTQNDEAFAAGVHALFEMESQYLSTREVDLIKAIFEVKEDRDQLFTLLRNTAFVPGHPLNSLLFSRLVGALPMVERDLYWSEHLRNHVAEMKDLVQEFVQQTKRNLDSSDHKHQLRLAAIFLLWTLGATNRFLRDISTRALVIFGARFPRALFNLAEESLTCNDPYIPERMLAAAYGAAMRLHSRPAAERFRKEALPQFGYRIFAAMFSKHATLATTHSLRRDYAKCIIDLALLHAPQLMTDSEKERIRPPFSGGIRNWHRRPDTDEYREGNSPLGFEWGNYTLGSLVHGRSTYDYAHPGYVDVKEKILWRIHDLGYSLSIFGELDKSIASRQWHTQHPTNIVERYGEKYAWIAFHELYGLLDDEGVLKRREFWESSPHPEEGDIDPSFGMPPHKFRILKHDILGVKQNNPKKWVQSGPDPNFSSYLAPNEIDSQKNEWFLLNASFLRRDDTLLRNGFTFIRAFYVHAHDFNEFRTFIHQESTGKWWRNTYDEPRGFFAGEFPWRSDFPDSYTDAFKVEIGARKVKNIPAPRIILHFNGKAFPQTPHKMPKWRHEPIERSLRVEVSILDIPFNGRSPLERPRGSLPSKQFCGSKGLWIGLPSWDMFDSSGRRVSITSHLGKVSNSDSATYADRSLVKEYLQTKSMKLVWVVFGERQMLTGAGGDAGYKQFTQCIGGTRER